jgi:hypothetical protein
MKLCWRRLRRGETDWELVLGLVGVPLLAVGLFLASRLPDRLVPVCRLRRVTGIPCPSCGAYRGSGMLLRGDVVEALTMQPLVIVGLLVMMVFAVYSGVVLAFGLPRARLSEVSGRVKSRAFLMCLVLFLVNWLYLVLSQ